MKKEVKEQMLSELVFFEEHFSKYSKFERLKIIVLFKKRINAIQQKDIIETIIDKLNNL